MPEAILPGSPLTNDIPNAPYPTAGQGLVLELNGLVPPAALATGVRTGTKFLRDDQTWQPSGSTTYRKTTAKVVNTTVSATDLLNGEITIAAGAMGTTGMLRLTCWGDWLQNSGGASSMMRFQLVLGGTTLLDTNSSGGAAIGASATRAAWKLAAEIMNLGSASSQLSSLEFRVNTPGFAGTANNPFLTGEGNFEAVSNSVNAQMVMGHGVNTTAVDTGTSKTLVLNVINASASASYETKLFGALVEIV